MLGNIRSFDVLVLRRWTCELFMSESESTNSTEDVRENIRETVSSVYHDLNNPLSIISGNAQFLLEIGKEEGLDDQFLSSAEDIKEAAQRMAESLHQLTRLKEELKEELEEES